MKQISFGESMKGTPGWAKAAARFNVGKRTSAAIFDHATRVETFRLFRASDDEKPIGDVRGFGVYARGVADAKFAGKLGAILLVPESYVLPGMGMTLCLFQPGVAYRVWSGPKFVDAIICFHCDQLGVVENDKTVPERGIGGSLQGRMNVLGDFQPARAALLAVTKEAFASDAAVQGIK